MSSWGGYHRYVTVAEKKQKAAKKLAQLRKTRPDIAPIIIAGTTLAHTWWGRSWNKNLERYADFSNRIGRGKSYVRHGAVLDLQVSAGEVNALVQGTRTRPYEVGIRISAVKNASWNRIKKQCRGALFSLSELVAGKFPREFSEIFFAEGEGLFPTPREITLACSCPDWAVMCKHVAAALYGVGARLDENPLLFFTLRRVDINELVGQVVEEKTDDLLTKAKQKSGKALHGADLSDLFGIELDGLPGVSGDALPEKADTAGSPKKSRRPPRTPAARPTRRAAGQKKASLLIEETIKRHPDGIRVAELEERTGVSRTRIYAVAARLKRDGTIRSLGHGIYGAP
ncbi:MAG: SWIM zinc finger family protein [Desulfofustis sp. PB-SRB1]|jgi:uncharacterized Zn finger protein|nr:SWIM zinc finger family protein [Desulfofustis sp. PB-SRB1]MBM1003578.1 SWIM zinc finger family protein [Desulfofustis sp. PB-SRB1]HBH30290.1 hypothetical protein [Desulfofustis sp.]HBH32006.1 hypothetical protein [Desulfofustis sp.]